MKDIKNIVVALDLTEIDDSVLGYVSFFSKAFPGVKVSCAHVVPQLDVVKTIFMHDSDTFARIMSLDESIIKELKNKTSRSFEKTSNVDLSYKVMEGNPLGNLLDYVVEQKADLIAIGQKSGEKGNGIIARNLLRKSGTDVLIIPEKVEHRINKILVALDFSYNSIRALESAVRLNTKLEKKAEIVCLNLFDVPDLSLYKISKTRDEFTRQIEKNIEEAYDRVISRFNEEERSWLSLRLIEKQQPKVASYILEFANETETDLLVMGAKGHSPVERLLVGSVTEKVLQKDEDLPILIVK